MNTRSFRILVFCYAGLILLLGGLVILRDLPSQDAKAATPATEQGKAARAEGATPPPATERFHGLFSFVVLASGILSFLFFLYLGMMRSNQTVQPLHGDSLRTPIAGAVVV
jgi:hypothetical protein